MSGLEVRIPATRRKKTSVYLDPAVYEPFVRACRSSGDSSCGVLEPYMFAYAEAVKRGIPVRTSNLTLNMTIVREVQRERRILPRGGEDVQVVECGSRDRCGYCFRPTAYKITRWPSTDLCLEEYVCAGCRTMLRYVLQSYGEERLSFDMAKKGEEV